jgi:iron complex outermembrane receptor protein
MFAGARIALLLVILTFICLPIAALEGRLLGIDGAPLAGARISVEGRPGSTISGHDGSFTITPDPAPPFILLVTRPDGVALAPFPVPDLPDGGLLEVQLAGALRQTVTVISGSVPDLELPPAAASTVIGRGDLEQRVPSTLGQVLETVPGGGEGGGGLSAVPSLRGLAMSRTLLMLDEGRITAERRAGPSATFLDPDTVEEVEVIRGPGSVAYGSDAFGGIIRARSRIPSPGDGLAVRYGLTGGLGAGEAGAMAEVSGDALGGALLAGIQARYYDDYRSPEGTVENSSAQRRGFRLAWQRFLFDGVLRLGWRTDQGRDIGKPDTDWREKRTTYPVEDSHRLGASFETPGPGNWSRITVTAAWDQYRLTLEKERFATAEGGRSLSGSDTDASDYELRVEAERPLGNATRLIVGLHGYGRYGLEAQSRDELYGLDGSLLESASETSIADARRNDLGAFAGLGSQLGRLKVNAGLRLDRVRSENRGGWFGDRSTEDTAVSGFLSAGIALRPNLELTAQAARGFRDALLSDRYYTGPSGRGTVTGNPNLEPETSRQYDLALRYNRDRLRLAVFGYLYRISNLIERFGEGDDYNFRNRGEAELRGMELEGTWALTELLLIRLGTQLQQGEALDDGAPLDTVPPRGIFLTLHGDTASGWSWMTRARAYGRDDRPGPTEKEVPGYAVFDAGLGLNFGEHLRLQLLARNLLDQTYSASADEKSMPAPGRSLQLMLRGTF